MARLDGRKHKVVNTAGESGDEEGEDVARHAPGVREVDPADERHEEQVVKQICQGVRVVEA